jgi:hypothetical protein
VSTLADKIVTSEQYSLKGVDFKSLGIGLAITLGGAFLTFASENLSNIDFGAYAVWVVPFMALIINIARKWLSEKKYVVEKAK